MWGPSLSRPSSREARTRHFRFGQSVRVSAVADLRWGPVLSSGCGTNICWWIQCGVCRLSVSSFRYPRVLQVGWYVRSPIRASVVPTFAADCPGCAVSEMCRIPGWSPRCWKHSSAQAGSLGIVLWVNCCCSCTVLCLLWPSLRPRAIVHQRWPSIPRAQLRVKYRLMATAAG